MLEFFVKQRSFQNRGSSVLLYRMGKVVSEQGAPRGSEELIHPDLGACRD